MMARSIRVRGVVQGVGFRPFIFRLAQANDLSGWVLNEPGGVDIHLEGAETALGAFLRDLEIHAPPAARIASVDVRPTESEGITGFAIRESERVGALTARISPDLPVCDACLRELFDPAERRYRYPYINCTNCGPRYSVIERLPYDRPYTTMKRWPLDAFCEAQYSDPADRRFHAQPVACPACGPHYRLEPAAAGPALDAAAHLLSAGCIVAIKGIGGYHLACDARNALAVASLRERKFRKEKPFALIVRDLDAAQRLATISADALALLTSPARPIVLVPALANLPGVAPGNCELGLMLPYAPVHHLLFESGAPEALVMTSANRSSEPIAYDDADALHRLAGLADAFLIGERPIARRVDDSVVRIGAFGPVVLRRSRGYAPGAVTALPAGSPILAVGADLKNTVTLVVEGQAFVSQHIGDLDQFEALRAFDQTVEDLLAMYDVDRARLTVVHDLHPQYSSTGRALALPSARTLAIQHHRAHVASVLAEREMWDERVLGISFDGTGYGDDGAIWGGEFFVGSVAQGLRRVLHLREAALPGGDAAARHPVQCAAGFLSEIDGLPDLGFPARYQESLQLISGGIRTFRTTSMGRLFDACAAILGFHRAVTFEGQAAIWLEQLARPAGPAAPYPFPMDEGTLDFRPLLSAAAEDRTKGRDPSAIARAFHRGIASGVSAAIEFLCAAHGVATVVLSGGVFQNDLLLSDLKLLLEPLPCRILTNSVVPPNDGGVSLGQAALAAFQLENEPKHA